MTPEQIQLVRLSFAKILNIKTEAARLFYNRLFVIAPETKSLFKGDMEKQAGKLMDTLALAIGSLQNPSAFNGTLDALAIRHVGYGVHDEQYDMVGQALLWALEQGIGEDFTPQVKSAWTALYSHVATRMRNAARPKAATA